MTSHQQHERGRARPTQAARTPSRPAHLCLRGLLLWIYKKLSYRRETARQLHTSFSAHSLIVHFTEHRICFTAI